MLEKSPGYFPAAVPSGPVAGFVFSGRVVKGNQIGRTIGFPTANIAPEGNAAVPVGVFACRVFIDNDPVCYRAMLNVGTRPTVNRGPEISMEANLFDFSGNLYGKLLRVEIVARIREERRFSGMEELKDQLRKDREAALSCLGS